MKRIVGPWKWQAWLLVAWLLVCVGGGCSTPPKEPEKYEGINRVSQNGSNLYFRAKQQYGVVRALDLHGEPLKEEMDKVMADLDGAIVSDSKCPLFIGKRGELFIELGPDGYGRAEQDLNQALKLSEDWIPAWIALADLEVRRGQTAKSRSYLDSADKGIQSLQQAVNTKPPPPFQILGLVIQQEDPNVKPPDDPSLKVSERRQLLLNWLQENEQWVLDSPSLLMASKSGAGKTVNTGNLFRRLRARLEYEKIVVVMKEGASPQVTLPMFDKVFEWDPDFFPARIEKAAEYRKAGQPREAERMLRPYIDSKDPKVANNCRLLYEMAAIYTDWYIQGGSDKEVADASRLAEEAFTKLHTLNPRHATGWIKRAELYAVAGTRAKRKDTLKDAKQWLANAREILKTDTPEMQRIAKQISDAEKGPATRASTREAQR